MFKRRYFSVYDISVPGVGKILNKIMNVSTYAAKIWDDLTRIGQDYEMFVIFLKRPMVSCLGSVKYLYPEILYY